MTIEIDIIVAADAWDAVDDLDPLTRICVDVAIAETGVRLMESCELSLNFCDDAEIRTLNARWRGKDTPTNVLSFPTPGAPGEKALLGDIVIAFGTVAREAREQEKSIEDHLRHMIIHGFLHLLGYDHESREEAEEMEALERRIAGLLGMKDPYAAVEDPGAHDPEAAYVHKI